MAYHPLAGTRSFTAVHAFQSAPAGDARLPVPADFQAMRDAYDAVAPDPAHFDEVAAKTEALVTSSQGGPTSSSPYRCRLC